MKDSIRKEMLKIRNSISDKEEISTIIVDRIKKLKIYKGAKVIGIYNSMPNEVDIKNFLKDDKEFLLPRVVNNRLIFLKIDSKTKYTKSKLGVIEPIINNNIYDDKMDLIIVPGVSFDKNLNRLGYGKGYYDCFLMDKNIYKIGVCFDKLLINYLPTNKYDIKMDLVVTEKRMIKNKSLEN